MRAAISALIGACAACGSADAPSTAIVVDSAGIRIVESRSPEWSEGDGWRVSTEPLLSIGSQDGSDGVAFGRLSGVYILDEERLAVLDEGAAQIGFFSHDGRRLSTFGRSGEGPGEFQSVDYVGLRGDSLWIFDVRQMRITVLDTRNAPFREMRIGLRNAALGPVGLLPDASVVLASNRAFDTAVGERPPPGIQRFRAVYHRVGPRGETADSLFTTPGAELMLRYGDGTIELLRPFLGRSVSHAVRGDEIVQGAQEAYEIGVYSSEGAVLSRIRRTNVDLTIDERAYEAAAETRVNAAPEQARAGLRALYENELEPEQRAPYGAFLVDTEGFLWVQDFAYEGAARTWAVFDPEGIWLGVVELPEGFQPTQILTDRMAGIWRDELEIEYARIYGLERE